MIARRSSERLPANKFQYQNEKKHLDNTYISFSSFLQASLLRRALKS